MFAFCKNDNINKWDKLGKAWYDWVPIVGPIVTLSFRQDGENPRDYIHVGLSPKCKNMNSSELAIAEQKCDTNMRDYAWSSFVRALGLNPGRMGVDLATTAIGGGLGAWGEKEFIKAGVKLLTKKAAAKAAGAVFVVVGGTDAVLSLAAVTNTGVNIWNAMKEAKERYCNCCNVQKKRNK